MIYRLIEETLFDIDIGNYITYGIELLDESGVVVNRISDIDTNRREVEELCERCNMLSLSPVHFRDVVDDFLVKL